jgi:ketosteroid isomerase-like protein
MSRRKGNLEAWLETALTCLLDKDVDSWVNHWAEDGRIEFPFAPAGYVAKVEGKAAIADYMASLPTKFDFRHFDILTTYSDASGQQAVVEFTCEGTVLETGRPYHQRQVTLISGERTELRPYDSVDSTSSPCAYRGDASVEATFRNVFKSTS